MRTNVPMRYRLIIVYTAVAVCLAAAALVGGGCAGARSEVSPATATAERTIEVRIGERVGPLAPSLNGGAE